MSRESSWQLGGFESSDEEKKDTKSSGSSSRRFEPPRILNIAHLHEGQINLRPSKGRDFAPTLRPLLFEGLVRKHETSDAEPSPAERAPEHDSESPAEHVLSGAPEAIRLPAHQGGEIVSAERHESDEDDDDDEEDTSSPLSWRAPAPLPRIENVPVEHPAEFDEVVEQLHSEFDEAPAGDPAETPISGEIPEQFTAGEDEPAILTHDTELPLAGSTTSAPTRTAGGRIPSHPPTGRPVVAPPVPPTTQAFMHNTPPTPPNWGTGNMAPMPSSPNTGGYTNVLEQPIPDRRSEQEAERRAMRRGLVAGFITGYVVKAFLARRKLKRYQEAAGKQISKQGEQIADLQSQQARLQERNAAQVAQVEQFRREQREQAERQQPQAPQTPQEQAPHYAPNVPPTPTFENVRLAPANVAPLGAEKQQPLPAVEALPPVQTAEAQTIVDENGNEITLQPGQRLERRGWYSVVLDEHGREVPGAIHYGEAFQREQKREQLSDAALSGSDNNSPSSNVGSPGGGVFTALPGVGMSSVPPASRPVPTPMIVSGQMDPAHSLPAGRKPVDPQHRLSEPRNPVVAAVTSPWLWLAVAVLLIAYFTAALV